MRNVIHRHPVWKQTSLQFIQKEPNEKRFPLMSSNNWKAPKRILDAANWLGDVQVKTGLSIFLDVFTHTKSLFKKGNWKQEIENSPYQRGWLETPLCCEVKIRHETFQLSTVKQKTNPAILIWREGESKGQSEAWLVEYGGTYTYYAYDWALNAN